MTQKAVEQEILRRLKEQALTDRVLITMDGSCASGKTTLAGKLAEVFGAAVIHTDDYVIPTRRKPPKGWPFRAATVMPSAWSARWSLPGSRANRWYTENMTSGMTV